MRAKSIHRGLSRLARRIESRRSGTLSSSAWERSGPDEGSVLVLALIFMVVSSLTVLALANLATNSLSSSTVFLSASQMQSAARSTTNLAIANMRYTPLLGSGQTLNANPPSYCWGSSAPSSQTFNFRNGSATNIRSITMAAWCTTKWTPQSSQTRIVTIDTCPISQNVFACEGNPFLETQVTFDDYPLGVHSGAVSTECNIYCGQGITVDYFNWSTSQASQLANAITVTSAVPTNAQVGGAYIPTATATSGQPVVITSSGSCVMLSGTVEFQSSGNCIINFNDPGNLTYAAAAQKSQSFSVGLGSQVALSISTTSATSNGSSYALALSTTGGSGSGAVTYAIDGGGTAAGCSLASGTLTATSAGSCVVTATKAADSSYGAASSNPTTVTFSPASQSPISIVATMTSATTQSLSITGGSVPGAAVTFSTTSVGCSISAATSTTATLNSTSGTCQVNASLAGNSFYSPVTTSATVTYVTAAAILVSPNSSSMTATATGGDQITLKIVDSKNQPVTLPTDLFVALSNTGNGHFVDGSGTTLTSVVIKAGSTSPATPVYFVDTKAQSVTIQATGAYSGSAPLTVIAGRFNQMGVTTSPTTPRSGNYTSTKLTIQAQDTFGNPTALNVPTTTYYVTTDYFGGNGFFANSLNTGYWNASNYAAFRFSGGVATVYFGDQSSNDSPTLDVFDGGYNLVFSQQINVN